MISKHLIRFLTLFFWAETLPAGQLEQVGAFAWASPSFVGLSGLEVTPDGDHFVAISDRGWYLAGQFKREAGLIDAVMLTQYRPILGQDGWPVSGRRVGDLSDAEGLAIGPEGEIWISFERWARVARYDSITTPAQWIEDHPSFYTYRDNRQLEALAVAPDGTLYTFPEKPLPEGFPIYRLDEEKWHIAGYIAQTDRFAIVGADFAPDGDLYLLERKLVLGLWWQSRIRKLDIAAPAEIETLWTSARGDFGNLEGIALWQDVGGLHVTLVSDDNGDPDEPTHFVELRLSGTEE